ncbi:MAG: YifB family Mg chelatase-like AAA ATPase [bacterium]|nr:YifB family Mg chelatase-like AAA ATPase [bacterium]
MSFARVFSAQPVLLDAHIITVEIDFVQGLHAFSVVGLADKAVEESRDRVSAAIKNTKFRKYDPEFEPPKRFNRKITVSLAPANVKKEGPMFDLPIAVAYLVSTGELPDVGERALFLGELALDGTLRRVRGVLPLVQKARNEGFAEVFLPEENAEEAALIDGIAIYGARSLKDVLEHLRKEKGSASLKTHPKTTYRARAPERTVNLEDVRGHDHAKRGLIVAAAGGHNIALYGPPGTGKTMLAQAFRGLLPPLSEDEALEVTGIHSIAGALNETLITYPPLRAPHHTSSYVSLVGGGTTPKPGEVTLAHKGVLFLDEFPEFDRRVINALRQPLEDGVVSISRAKGTALFPSDFILIAAMNPCPCGHFGSSKCTCSGSALQRYRQKISGPIMDRIDMWIEVGAIDHKRLSEKRVRTKETQDAREIIARAREAQEARFKKHGRLNSGMSSRGLEHHVPLTAHITKVLNAAAERMGLSPRAYHRCIKLARTVADLGSAKDITEDHMLEALQYRPKQDW